MYGFQRQRLLNALLTFSAYAIILILAISKAICKFLHLHGQTELGTEDTEIKYAQRNTKAASRISNLLTKCVFQHPEIPQYTTSVAQLEHHLYNN